MPVKAGQIEIEVRASAQKLRSDMDAAVREVRRIGDGGREAGRELSKGMEAAAVSVAHVAKVATEGALAIAGGHNALSAAVAKYSSVAAASGGTTEALANSYRALRIYMNPSMFTVATVAVGILAEKTMELVNARAKLIEQQSLIAAKSGLSFASVERADNIASISGGNAGSIRSLQSALATQLQDSGALAGLSSLGLTGDEPNLLAQIAKGFDSIEDPARRAAIAVQIFGDSHAEDALKQLTPAFADADATIKRFGLGLDSVSREQIDRFHRDMESLKRDLTDWSDVDAGIQKFKEEIEQLGAAFYSLLRAPGLDTDLFEKIRGTINPGALTAAELSSNRRGMDADGNAQHGIQADDFFSQAQGAEFRKSQTLEGQKAAQKAYQDSADSAFKSLSSDAKKRQEDPNDTSLLSNEQRFALALQQQSSSALATAIAEKVKAMEAAKEAQKLAQEAAERLSEFQGKAGDRLQGLLDQIQGQAITTPIASYIHRAGVEIRRDADRTTDAEKTGRAAIETGGLQQLVASEMAKSAKETLAEAFKDAAAFRPKLIGVDLPSKEDSRQQVRKDDEDELRVRDAGERKARLATIQSQPGDEAALAQRVLDIRLQTVTAEWAILSANEDNYDLEDLILARKKLETEEANAQLTYENAIAEIEKSREQAALGAGGAYQLQLRTITQQLEALNKIAVTDKNISDIEMARVALAQKAAEIEVQRLLALGTLKDGWDAFWIEMQEQAEKPGKILFDGMNDALDKVSGNLAKLITGQHKKTSFGKDLESVGQSVAQSSMKALLQKGLGAVGKKIGIRPPAGKPDGTKMNPYHVVVDGATSAAGAKASDPTAAAGGAVAKGALGALGGSLGGLLGKLGGLFGGGTAVSSSISFMAAGGDADPGRVYGVAEAGEAELISPKNSSRITPLSKLPGGGNTHTYNIDARGADLGAENRVARAIEFAHNSAVSGSVRANSERAKRTPKRSS